MLKQLNKQLPVITMLFSGIGDCLESPDGKPMSISIRAPRMSVVVKSNMFTTMISRWTDTLTPALDRNLTKDQIAEATRKKAMIELAKTELNEQFNEVAKFQDFGLNMLKEYAYQAWWDSDDKYNVRFVDSSATAEKENEELLEKDNPDKVVVIALDKFSDNELIDLTEMFLGNSKELLDGTPRPPVDVPMNNGGDTVDAKSFRKVPDNLGHIPPQTRTGSQ